MCMCVCNTDPSLYRPSSQAYQAYIHTLSRMSDWEGAFAAVSELETYHAKSDPAALSPMHGLAAMARAVGKNAKSVSAAYQVVSVVLTCMCVYVFV